MARSGKQEAPGGFRIERAGGDSRVALEGVVGAARAHALQDAANALAAAKGGVRIDLSGLRHLDCAGVQVLLALDAALKGQRRTLTLESVPEAVRATFRNAGLGHLG